MNQIEGGESDSGGRSNRQARLGQAIGIEKAKSGWGILYQASG